MSMRAFFPSLRPSVVNGLWFDLDVPYDEEAELRELEKEHHDGAWEISQICSDLPPIGKAPALIGPETDDEDNNDDSDDTDSHDNDEDEEDMEAAGGGPANNAADHHNNHQQQPAALIAAAGQAERVIAGNNVGAVGDHRMEQWKGI